MKVEFLLYLYRRCGNACPNLPCVMLGWSVDLVSISHYTAYLTASVNDLFIFMVY
jgi:hypothetical protein